MRVVIGSDHAGFELKQKLSELTASLGHELIDIGTDSSAPVDYPDFAEKVGMAIISTDADRGVLVCGSGVGACVAANKIRGIRAGICHDVYSAHQGVEHDDMNVLVLGSRVVGPELAKELTRAYLSASFTGEARHQRRLMKIRDIEERYCRK